MAAQTAVEHARSYARPGEPAPLPRLERIRKFADERFPGMQEIAERPIASWYRGADARLNQRYIGSYYGVWLAFTEFANGAPDERISARVAALCRTCQKFSLWEVERPSGMQSAADFAELYTQDPEAEVSVCAECLRFRTLRLEAMAATSSRLRRRFEKKQGVAADVVLSWPLQA